MYDSLKLPWTPDDAGLPSAAEKAYRAAGLVKTKGTIYVLPPPDSQLRETFNAQARPGSKSVLSCGAKALCKHFERGGASSEHGIAHPFWTLPTGSNENKTRVAAAILDRMLGNPDANEIRSVGTSEGEGQGEGQGEGAIWRNVMMLHSGVAVYEIRNRLGYGMRWTLQLGRIEEEEAKEEGQELEIEQEEECIEKATAKAKAKARSNDRDEHEHEHQDEHDNDPDGWFIKSVAFRGFVEPIEGLEV